MNQGEFEVVKGKMIADYSKEKVRYGIWGEEEALELSKETFETLLKNGAETENNYLYNILDDRESNIAFVWMAVVNSEAFIYNVDIFDEYKEKIDYKEIFTLVEDKIRELGAKKVSVHTFGYNKEVVEKYEEFGFEVTDVTLCKKL